MEILSGRISQDDVEVVRKPLRARERSSRTLDQRLALRFPVLLGAYARLFARLRPGSRLRQMLLSRGARLTAEAVNRRDVDAVVRGYRPDYEFHPPHEFVDAGFMPPRYRGPAGYHEFVSDWSDVWGTDLRMEPLENIDLGTRVVILYTVLTRGQGSGVRLAGKWATVSTLKHGRVIRDQVYLDHAAALEAVGLRE
jgi:ketosteroid isomerase-like protein